MALLISAVPLQPLVRSLPAAPCAFSWRCAGALVRAAVPQPCEAAAVEPSSYAGPVRLAPPRSTCRRRAADRLDKLLLVIGTLAALANGASLPVFTIIFGDFVGGSCSCC
jgi:hypothetical protein